MVSAPYGSERELSPNFIYQMEGIFPASLLPASASYFTAHGTSLQTPSAAVSSAGLLSEHLPNYYSSVQQGSAAFFRPYAIPTRASAIGQAGRHVGPAVPVQGTQEPSFLRKRNERERQRVKCVNEGYTRLRNHLPSELAEKRLSKVETLRAAIRYIEYLQDLLAEDENKDTSGKNKDSKKTEKRSISQVEKDSREEKENEVVLRKRVSSSKNPTSPVSFKSESNSSTPERSPSWNSPTDFLSQDVNIKEETNLVPSDSL